MLKPLLLLSLIATSFAAVAQTDKGNWMVGSGIGSLNASIAPGINFYNIALRPTAGYFFSDNFAVGATLHLGAGFGKHTRVWSYGLLPFSRYYFGKKHTKLFVEGSAGVIAMSSKSGEPAVKNEGANFYFSAGPGLAHFITPNVGLEAALMLRGTNSLNNNAATFYEPGLNVGFQVYLNCLKKKALKAEQATDTEEDE